MAKAMLTACPQGLPVALGAEEERVVHAVVAGTRASVHVYACRPPGGRQACEVDMHIVDSRGRRSRLCRASVPSSPAPPALVLNGWQLGGACRLVASATAAVSVFGYATEQHTADDSAHGGGGAAGGASDVVLTQQHLVFAATEERPIAPGITTTLITTSSTRGVCRAVLGAAASGTVKHIIMCGKHPDAEGDGGACEVVPFEARFPPPSARGVITLRDVGDAASLYYTGAHWMILNAGARAE